MQCIACFPNQPSTIENRQSHKPHSVNPPLPYKKRFTVSNFGLLLHVLSAFDIGAADDDQISNLELHSQANRHTAFGHILRLRDLLIAILIAYQNRQFESQSPVSALFSPCRGRRGRWRYRCFLRRWGGALWRPHFPGAAIDINVPPLRGPAASLAEPLHRSR